MTRLVTKLSGRRLIGWAYQAGGGGRTFDVCLSQDGVEFARVHAGLSLPPPSEFVTPDEAMGHAFSVLIEPKRLEVGRSPIVATVPDTGAQREIVTGGLNSAALRSDLRIDHIDHDGFRGWCWDATRPDGPQHLILSAPPIGSGRSAYVFEFEACLFRPDLHAVGMAKGHVGFQLNWPIDLPLASRKNSKLRFSRITLDLGARYRRLSILSATRLPQRITSF